MASARIPLMAGNWKIGTCSALTCGFAVFALS
ncbi:MAG: hypothetical protein JWQ32_2000 [Marmoricola sp.]|nr:hypothetical protein [Marmoricola sp.]